MSRAQFKKLLAERDSEPDEEEKKAIQDTPWEAEEALFASKCLEKNLEHRVYALWMHRPLVHFSGFICQPEFLFVRNKEERPGFHLVTIKTIERPRVNCSVKHAHIYIVSYHKPPVDSFHCSEQWGDFAVSEAETGEEVDSNTELRFTQILDTMLAEGEILAWVQQPTIRMAGQVYTPDFMTLTPAGGVEFHEIKGGYSLVSETRSSVKIRWAKSILPNFKFYWHKYANRQWKKREIKAELPKHTGLTNALKLLKVGAK